MSLSKVRSYGLEGLEGYEVDIEVDLHKGIPSYDIVGLPDTSVKESRERVKSAFKNNGFNYPIGKIVVNLAPADTKKEGTIYDLPLALGLLLSTQQLAAKGIGEYIVMGELSLNGDIRGIRGVLPMLISAKQGGIRKAIIPYENAKEARYIEGVDVYAFSTLKDVCAFFTGEKAFSPVPVEEWRVPEGQVSDYDTEVHKGAVCGSQGDGDSRSGRTQYSVYRTSGRGEDHDGEGSGDDNARSDFRGGAGDHEDTQCCRYT